jgi:hypothetical protein
MTVDGTCHREDSFGRHPLCHRESSTPVPGVFVARNTPFGGRPRNGPFGGRGRWSRSGERSYGVEGSAASVGGLSRGRSLVAATEKAEGTEGG